MIVIPMAGLSRRFRDAGYNKPKYMLDLHGRTLFRHAVESFRAYFESEPFLFIARSEAETERFVRAELETMGVAEHRTVILDKPTRGQAETVRLGLELARVDGDSPLAVFNIDTIRPGYRHPDAAWYGRADGHLEVMTGDDPGFSYVAPTGEDDRVSATAEKEVISNLASTGLYAFRRAADFLAISDGGEEDHVRGELYIAPLYNSLIRKGADIRFWEVPLQDVIFCGTPEQYRELLQQPAAAWALGAEG